MPFAKRRLISIASAFSLVSNVACKTRIFNDEDSGEPDGASLQSANSGSSSIACEVIVAGGSLAALSAALTSAKEGRVTCLLEPTDWPGGQLTSSAVSAIDFAHHSVNGLNIGQEQRKSANSTPLFMSWANSLDAQGGKCLVTNLGCFHPTKALNGHILPEISRTPQLKVFKNTVVKSVETEGNKIISVTSIQRTARSGTGYENFLSNMIQDWYSYGESSAFSKKKIVFSRGGTGTPVVIDATEFGDVLVVSGASFLQGPESSDNSLQNGPGYDTAGQAATFPFVMALHANSVSEPAVTGQAQRVPYSFGKWDWDRVWRYRRIKGSAAQASTGDLSLQNWNVGNDYLDEYIFKSKSETQSEAQNWSGGININAMRGAEQNSLAFYKYLKEKAPPHKFVTLEKSALGTGTGLSKVPYIRDTRRSIGNENFVLKYSDISGPESAHTGKAFPDRLGIGAYVVDVHSVRTLPAPGYLNSTSTLPYFIPLRALTNRDFSNLLVAGKTMAQTYHANGATRLQPVEWNSGVAAGATAAFMAHSGKTSEEAYKQVGSVQAIVKKYAPIDWTLGGDKYP